MPFSIIINGYPKDDVPAIHVQGPALQGMFLGLIEKVNPTVARQLHADNRYRPYTLSPLGIGERGKGFQGFRLPRERMLKAGTPCYLRVTLLEDTLFPTFSHYFLNRPEPTFRLGDTHFAITEVLATPENDNPWSAYISYSELIEQTGAQPLQRRITLRFVTPTCFSRGGMDLPLPLPRLVFQSYLRRFQEFYDVKFLPEFVDLIDLHTGISRMDDIRTDTIVTKNTTLAGFIGDVSFEISRNAPPDLVFQMNLLANFAFFCGTGKKTTVGMGQTVRIKN